MMRGFFTRKKDLIREQEEKKRLQGQLDYALQNHEWEEQRRRSEQEKQDRMRRREQEAKDRMLEEERNRKLELQEQMERLQLEQMERRREEESRLARQAEKKRQKEQRLKLEQQERERKMKKLKEASPETLRVLRELIRQRYALDCEIWDLRNSRKVDQWIVEEKMFQSDDVMDEIMGMLNAWGNNSDRSWKKEEWERVADIRRRLENDKKRVWRGNPPWAEGRLDRFQQ